MTYRYTVQSVARQDHILLLTLVPKQGSDALQFAAGQYAAIGFIRHGRPTPMRCFSIVSTPKSGVLQFAMRVHGHFTKTAAEVRVGDQVYVQGPFGDFTINEAYDQRIVMLAGGIGITPSLGMLRDLTERQIALPVTLLFSNRSTKIPFYQQLHELQLRNPYIQVEFFGSSTGSGSITRQHLRQLVGSGTTYFICGPTRFTKAMHANLSSLGVHESRIISELFTQGSAATLDSGLSIRSLTYGLSAAVMVLATGFIMALDLSRVVPKLASAQSTTTTSAQTSTSPNTQTNTGNNNTTSPTPTTSTPTPSTQPTYTYYQTPISRMS